MMNLFLNFSFLSILKLIFIIFFIILNFYLIFLEIKLASSNTSVPHWKQAGPIDANLTKTLKNYLALSASVVSCYSAYFTHQQYKDLKSAASKEMEFSSLESNANDLKTQVYNSQLLNEATKNKVTSIAISIKEEIQKTHGIQTKIESLLKSISSKTTDVAKPEAIKIEGIRAIILEEIAVLDKDRSHQLAELKTSTLKTEKFTKELTDVSISDIKESSFSFNFFEVFESYGAMEKMAISILLLNHVLISAVISIIYIFYGEYLINRFNLAKRYPNLAKLIELRIKFQSNFLLLSVGWIIAVILVEIIFCLMILTI